MSSGGHSLAVSPDVVPTFSQMKVRRKHKWMLLTAHPETLEIGIAATGVCATHCEVRGFGGELWGGICPLSPATNPISHWSLLRNPAGPPTDGLEEFLAALPRYVDSVAKPGVGG
jgi:hypothetical protein